MQRTRNVKRHLWTSRPWRKSVAGHSYLRADGYITRIEAGSAAWRFEVRAIGATEICRCGDGDIGCDEECDDGNRSNGDGCDELCEDEGTP